MHSVIALTVLAILAGLLATAFAPSEWTTLRGWWTARRLAARAWRDGAELVAGLAAITAELPVVKLPDWHNVPPRDTSPPCKDSRLRCRECRLGGDCRDTDPTERPAYAAGRPLPPVGRHTTTLAAARWLAGDWWQADLPVRLRRELGRLAGAGTIPTGVS